MSELTEEELAQQAYEQLLEYSHKTGIPSSRCRIPVSSPPAAIFSSPIEPPSLCEIEYWDIDRVRGILFPPKDNPPPQYYDRNGRKISAVTWSSLFSDLEYRKVKEYSFLSGDIALEVATYWEGRHPSIYVTTVIRYDNVFSHPNVKVKQTLLETREYLIEEEALTGHAVLEAKWGASEALNKHYDSNYYDRQGNAITRNEWSNLFNEEPDYEKVKQETLSNGIWISTVWLGLNHNFTTEGPPLIFETMVFQSEDNLEDLDCRRYATEEEAFKGHEELKAKWEAA